ncbi:hypothetical protein [Fulmarus glacialis papillomavirus 1]|uniref:Uncharacterized protein n=1 Tax=Fulmarus glacialis papillomavirus 1 TaxID=1463817 RepID=A0A059TB37_9PAPI|nr:hypothetical protein [Fulmarus glacialis papillomavirus 1]AHV82125.1 hypothetical protein [Fulmarus glacialis papillomavirus 1]
MGHFAGGSHVFRSSSDIFGPKVSCLHAAYYTSSNYCEATQSYIVLRCTQASSSCIELLTPEVLDVNIRSGRYLFFYETFKRQSSFSIGTGHAHRHCSVA